MELVMKNGTFLDDDGSFGGTFIQIVSQVTPRRCRMGPPEIDKCLRHVLIEDCGADERRRRRPGSRGAPLTHLRRFPDQSAHRGGDR
jgi:hypothetical protein